MSTDVSACACMGPQGKDPVCPCRMRAMGKEPHNSWTPEKVKELNQVLGKVFGWKCAHPNATKEEHLTGDGAMEYVEWYDNHCPDCGEKWTTNE